MPVVYTQVCYFMKASAAEGYPQQLVWGSPDPSNVPRADTEGTRAPDIQMHPRVQGHRVGRERGEMGQMRTWGQTTQAMMLKPRGLQDNVPDGSSVHLINPANYRSPAVSDGRRRARHMLYSESEQLASTLFITVSYLTQWLHPTHIWPITWEYKITPFCMTAR